MEKTYRFQVQIVSEKTGEIIVSGGIDFTGEDVSEIGDCDIIDEKVGEVMHVFCHKLEQEENLHKFEALIIKDSPEYADTTI